MSIYFTPEIQHYVSKTGNSSICIRCSFKRKLQRVNTGVNIPPKFWDDTRKQIKKQHPLSDNYNRILQQLILKLQKTYAEMLEKGEEIELQVLVSKMESPQTVFFFQFAEETKMKEFLSQKKLGTYRRYKTVLEKFKEFTGPALSIKRVDYTLLKKYEDHLLLHHKNSVDTISSNLSVLRSIINEAIRHQLYDSANPFNQLTLRFTDNTKEKLTIEELQRFSTTTLPEIFSLTLSRDFFLACFYAGGCRAGDMVSMTHDNIINGKLKYKMGKTGKQVILPVCKHLKDIINKYQTNSQYIFPLLNDVDHVNEIIINSKLTYINKYLKEVCKYAGIFKKITTHCARHTFADISLSVSGNDIYALKEVLGHSSVRTTEIYLRERQSSNSVKLIEKINLLKG